MPTIVEGQLTFTFPAGWQAEKFDDLTFYRKHFNAMASSKAVDIIAVTPDKQELWLIEVKDYRQHSRTKPGSLFEEFATKVRDTLACLPCMAIHANVPGDLTIAKAALKAKSIRVVLHVEQPRSPSKLFPWVIDPKTARDIVRKVARAADPHGLAGDMAVLTGKISWSVT